MSTVKIKTEPATAATTTTAVNVKVKLEPSLSAGDIKLEQHTSDIDTKVELDSEADSGEEYIKSENDDGDTDQETDTHNYQRLFICDQPGCGRGFNFANNLKVHQHEHRLQTDVNIFGKTYTLSRQSLDDRWPCPIPGCETMLKTVDTVCTHTRKTHDSTLRQQKKRQQPPSRNSQFKRYFLNVDEFYVNGICCGYHSTIEVFICHECRLVPECLLTHLQQTHGFDEKSIDNGFIPERAVTADADPNTNQHSSNTHLAAAISYSSQQQHPDIAQGWLCVTSSCGYSGYTTQNKTGHKRHFHQGEQLSTVPALVLRLSSSKVHTSYCLIARIDQASGTVTASNSRMKRHKFDYSYNGLNAQDENEDGTSQNETTEAFNQKQQWKCEYQNCGRLFSSSSTLSSHRYKHKLEVVINVRGNTFALNRQSLDERWTCPVPDCQSTLKTIRAIRLHIVSAHSTLLKQKRTNIEDHSDIQQQQLQIIKRRQSTIYYLNVDDFYVGGTRCGYHHMTGVFLCHECRLIPECLLAHLQQTHAFDQKSIDNEFLPERAKITGSDPNSNQHTNNSNLALAIREPYQQHHPGIVQGWQCIKSDCGYCCSTKRSRNEHHHTDHRGEQQSTAPALVLRLLYGKAQTSSFLIIRLDAITDRVKPNNSADQYNNEYEDDDGDELVLSDYGSDDDIH